MIQCIYGNPLLFSRNRYTNGSVCVLKSFISSLNSITLPHKALLLYECSTCIFLWIPIPPRKQFCNSPKILPFIDTAVFVYHSTRNYIKRIYPNNIHKELRCKLQVCIYVTPQLCRSLQCIFGPQFVNISHKANTALMLWYKNQIDGKWKFCSSSLQV